MKTLGIAAHSYEGGSLCFISACREGGILMGPHMHPEIVLSAVPMALSMPSWELDDYSGVGEYLARGAQQVADAGADFYICPDNTAHIVLEEIANELPIPGLHIAQVVCHEIASQGWTQVGLLGTRWTMTGPVYENALAKKNLKKHIPDEPTRQQINNSIFDELCQGVFSDVTTQMYIDAIADLKSKGAECVILGCTEIPLIINAENSPLPILDSTRLLAQYAVREAISERPIEIENGWLEVHEA